MDCSNSSNSNNRDSSSSNNNNHITILMDEISDGKTMGVENETNCSTPTLTRTGSEHIDIDKSGEDNEILPPISSEDIERANGTPVIPIYNPQQQQQNAIADKKLQLQILDHNNNHYNPFKRSSSTTDFTYDGKEGMFAFGFRKRYKIAMYIFDWVFSITAVLVGALLFYLLPVRGRLFTLNDPSISYPFLTELVTFPSLVAICLFAPMVTILIVTILHKRNWHDFHHAQLGLVQSVALTLMVVAIMKCFIGGLRPNFLERCKPTPESIAAFGTPLGYGGIYYSKEICTGDSKDVNDAMSAHPSGHAGLATCGLVYLAMFLHARLKTFNNRGHLFIYVLVMSCITGALLVGISRIVDYRHTFANVVEGWIIGTFLALSMYRLNYLSLTGIDNHVPVADYWIYWWGKTHQLDQNNLDNSNNNNKNNSNNIVNQSEQSTDVYKL